MKKRILMWAMMLTMGLSGFANNEVTVNQRTIDAFKKDFATANDVRWEITKNYVKATFTLNEQIMFAYYSQDGDLLMITRNIVSTQLPLGLLSSLKKDYNSYWISDLFETSSNNEASYYITLQNADHSLVLKSDGTIGWYVFKKERKN